MATEIMMNFRRWVVNELTNFALVPPTMAKNSPFGFLCVDEGFLESVFGFKCFCFGSSVGLHKILSFYFHFTNKTNKGNISSQIKMTFFRIL